jgi:hypothetical protein
MATPTVMSDLSTTAASNSPAGSEAPISTDDFHRAIQAILRHTNAKGTDIASATTTNIGAATGEFVDITGTTTITGLGTIAAGIERTLRFTGALTLTHNATSLILPGGANITTYNGYIALFRSLGSGNWVLITDNKNIGAYIQNQTYTAFTTGGTSSAFTVTAIPAITTYTNSRLAVTLNAAPSGSPTINYNALGAKNFKYKDYAGTKQFVTSTQAPSGHLCDLWYDGTDVVLQNPLPIGIINTGYIYGLQCASAADTIHDITVSTGVCSDSAGTTTITLGSSITKQIDAAWAVGTNAGGMFTGTVANNTTYYLFIIRRSDTGVVDAGWDTSITAANKPANYDSYRLIMSIKTDGTAQIRPFEQNGNGTDREVRYLTPILDISNVAQSTSYASTTLSIPAGKRFKGFGNILRAGSTSAAIQVRSPNYSDGTPSVTASPLATTGLASAAAACNSTWTCHTDTSSQIQTASSAGTPSIYLTTEGYLEYL